MAQTPGYYNRWIAAAAAISCLVLLPVAVGALIPVALCRLLSPSSIIFLFNPRGPFNTSSTADLPLENRSLTIRHQVPMRRVSQQVTQCLCVLLPGDR
jgi:hypothetical protein